LQKGIQLMLDDSIDDAERHFSDMHIVTEFEFVINL